MLLCVFIFYLFVAFLFFWGAFAFLLIIFVFLCLVGVKKNLIKSNSCRSNLVLSFICWLAGWLCMEHILFFTWAALTNTFSVPLHSIGKRKKFRFFVHSFICFVWERRLRMRRDIFLRYIMFCWAQCRFWFCYVVRMAH